MTYQELFSSVDLLVLWRVFPAAGRNECDRLKINLSACVNGNEGTCHTVHVQCVFNSLCKKLWLHEQYFQPWASKSLKRAEKDHIWEITSYILMWRSPNRTNSEYCITDLLPQLPVLLGCSKKYTAAHTHTHTPTANSACTRHTHAHLPHSLFESSSQSPGLRHALLGMFSKYTHQSFYRQLRPGPPRYSARDSCRSLKVKEGAASLRL